MKSLASTASKLQLVEGEDLDSLLVEAGDPRSQRLWALDKNGDGEWVTNLIEHAITKGVRLTWSGLSRAIRKHRGVRISAQQIMRWMEERQADLDERARQAGVLGR